MKQLYRYEAKGIQSFILQTNKLKEIKGGSILIENLGKLLETVIEAMGVDLKKEEVILNCAAGGANLSFPHEDDVKAFASVWPMIVSQYAPGLQVVQAWVSMNEDSGGGEKAWEKLQEKLREARNVLDAPHPEIGHCIHRCPRTGLPAVAYDRDGKMMDAGLKRRSVFGSDGERGDSVGAKIAENERWALDLEKHIGSSRTAVVHIDGNDLGKRIQEICVNRPKDTNKALRDFSETLSSVTTEAAIAGYRAVKDKLCEKSKEIGEKAGKEMQSKNTGCFPGRPIVLGGDDVTFLLRNDLAWGFVKAYLEAFESLSSTKSETLGGSLTACAGIVTTNVGFPFDRAHDLAESLCKFAKDRLRADSDSKEPTPSGVAFYRVTTSMVEDYQSILKSELSSVVTDGKKQIPLLMTSGPYTLKEKDGFNTLEAIKNLAELFQNLPSSAVRETIDLLKIDIKGAEERWNRLGEVMGDPDAQAARSGQVGWGRVKKALEDMNCRVWSGLTEEIVFDGECFATPLLDAWNLIQMTGDKR